MPTLVATFVPFSLFYVIYTRVLSQQPSLFGVHLNLAESSATVILWYFFTIMFAIHRHLLFIYIHYGYIYIWHTNCFRIIRYKNVPYNNISHGASENLYKSMLIVEELILEPSLLHLENAPKFDVLQRRGLWFYSSSRQINYSHKKFAEFPYSNPATTLSF